jgi:hypothetical protein
MRRESIEYASITDSDNKKLIDGEIEKVENQIAMLDFRIAVADEILSRPTAKNTLPAPGEVTQEHRNAATAQRDNDVTVRDQAVVTWEAMVAVTEQEPAKPSKKKAA